VVVLNPGNRVVLNSGNQVVLNRGNRVGPNRGNSADWVEKARKRFEQFCSFLNIRHRLRSG